MSEVTLYDLPSKGRCACWSLNPWKTRLMLNLKNIPYKTQWIEYPDIAPIFKSFGIPPNDEGTPYTIPAIHISPDDYVMDSRKIATELERLHPSPPLHLDSPILPRVEQLIAQGMASFRGVAIPKIPRNLLNPRSAEYLDRTRLARFGMSLPQLEKETGVDSAWEAAKPALKELGAILRAEGGPFVLGKTVSYADLVIVGALQFFRRIQEDLFQRAVEIEPALGDLYEASKLWLERDDH